jgi:hypothetical protein
MPDVGNRRPRPGPGRRVGEREPGQRRHDDVERVGPLAAVAGRIGEQLREPQNLDEAARPVVGEDQGQGHRLTLRPRSFQPDEVHLPRADVRPVVVRQGVELGLDRPPVEPIVPVVQQLLQVVGIGARCPGLGAGGIGQPGPGDTEAQVVEDTVRNLDLKRGNGHAEAQGRRRRPQSPRLGMPATVAC